MAEADGLVVSEHPDLLPQCPHCNVGLGEIRARRLDPTGKASSFRFGKRYVYACPSCNKVIAITHRKGFWAG